MPEPVVDLSVFDNDTELALVGAALLDEQLYDLLFVVLQGSKRNREQLLASRAGLKVLARAVGLIDDRELRELTMVFTIRHKFAHSTLPRPDFADQTMLNLIGQSGGYRTGRDEREVFIEAVGRLRERLEERKSF